MRYENLLTRSFAILRRRPWLWLLALLAGETSSGGGGGGGSVNFQLTARRPAPDLSWVPQWLADRAGLIAEIALAVLVLALAWFLVSCIASGALVGAVARIDDGDPITLDAAWRIGVAAFRRVLALKLLLAVAFLVPALLLAIPPLAGSLGGTRGLLSGIFVDLPLLLVLLAWAAFLGWFSPLALRACVLEQLGARAALAAAWALLKRRFHRIALTTLIFLGVGFGIGILTSVLFALLATPFLGSLIAELSQGRWAEIPGTVLLWLAVLSPASLAVSSLVGAYFAIAWTLAYRRFDVEGEPAEPPPLPA